MKHPILLALYEERMSYMQQETQVHLLIEESQGTISMLIASGQDPKEEKDIFKHLIRRLSHIWDALIETNRQIHKTEEILSKRERCPICNDISCNLCIPF